MYSTHNEEIFFVTERFIRSLKNIIYKYLTSKPKDMCTDKLDDTGNKRNNTYHRKIKMKPVDVNLTVYFDFNEKNNKEDSKLKVGNNVRRSKCKNNFAKGYVLHWFTKVLRIKKLKTLCHGHVISDKKLLQRFTKTNCKSNQKVLGVENVIKEKGNILDV